MSKEAKYAWFSLIESFVFAFLPVMAMTGDLSFTLVKVLMIAIFIFIVVFISKAMIEVIKKRQKVFSYAIYFIAIFLWHYFMGMPFLLNDFEWCPSCP